MVIERKKSEKNKTFQESSSNAKTEEHRNKSVFSKCCSWFKYVILILLLPPFLNYAALHQEQRFLLVTETLYDIGNGQKLSFKCEGKGKPTVLLEAPTGSSSDIWSLLIPHLSKITKVCTYDRAGIGFSERPYRNTSEEEISSQDNKNKDRNQKWAPFTVERMVDDLFSLITYRTHQVEKPFIFVGSEMGALIARFYTQIYEADVSDIVMIDPLVENIFEVDDGVWSHYWFNHIIPSYEMMQLLAATGMSRMALVTGLINQPYIGIPMKDSVIMNQKHFLCHPRHLSSVVDEHHFINETFSQMQTLFMMKAFPSNVSITIINGNYYDDELPEALNKAWQKAQNQLLSRLHSNSHHININEADRKMIYKNPEALVTPIKRLITKHRRAVKTEKI